MKQHQFNASSSFRNIPKVLFLVVGAVLNGPSELAAQGTVVWDGSTDTTWSEPDATSWSSGNYAIGDNVEFLGAGTGTVTISGTVNPGSILVDSVGDYLFTGGTIGGTGALTKNGTGKLTLQGTGITFTGNVNANAGTLILTDATNFANGADPQMAMTIAGGATIEFAVSGNHNLGTTGGTGLTISGTGTLLKSGAGALNFNNQGDSSYKVNMALGSGALIDVQQGTMRNGGWQGQTWTNNLADLNVAAGATFDIWDGNGVRVDAITDSGTITRGHGTATSTLVVGVDNGTGDFSGRMGRFGNGNVLLQKEGTGAQTLSGTLNNTDLTATLNGGTLVLAKASSATVNALAAGLTVNSGTTLRFAGTGGNQIAVGGDITVNNGGTLDVTVSESIDGLTSGATSTIDNTGSAAATLTFGESNTGGDIDGLVQDSGTGTLRLVKQSTGEVRLGNTANTYSGGTSINGGLLRASDLTLGLSTAALTLDGGSLFNVSASGGGAFFDADLGRQVILGASGGGIRSGWGNTTVSGQITSSLGAGAFTIINDGAVILTNTANNYAGNTVIGGVNGSGNNATLQLGAANVIPNGVGKGDIVFNASAGGTAALNLNGISETINGLSSGGTGASEVRNTIGSATLTVGDNNTTSTFNGRIGNSGGGISLTKIGTGTQTLGGTTDNSALTATVNAGILELAKTSSGSVRALNGGGTVLTVNSGGTARLAGNGDDQISIDGDVLINAGGTFDLNGRSEGFDGLNTTGTIDNTAAANSVLTFGQNNTGGTIAGIVQDSGTGTLALVKAGTASYPNESIITNIANSYSGGTTITGGHLRASDRTLGTAALTLDGGTLFNVSGNGSGNDTYVDNDLGRQVILGASGGGIRSGWGAMTVSGQVTSSVGTGALTIINDGAVTLSNNTNNYAGNTVIGGAGSGNNATFQLGAANVIPNGAGKGNIVFNASGGGTASFNLNGFSETINGLSSGGAGASEVRNTTGNAILTVGDNNTTSTFNGRIWNNGGGISLIKIGSGTQTLGGTTDNNALAATVDAGVLEFAKTSTAAVHALGGASTVLTVNNGGTARLAGTGDDQIYFQGDVIVNAGGIFDLNGRSEGVDGLNSSGIIDNTAATNSILTFGQDNSGGTIGGTVQNSGTGTLSLVKAGSGTTTITGTNTYTGSTLVSGGILRVDGALTGTSGVTVANGAKLQGTGSIAGGLTVQNGGRLAPGNSIGTITQTGPVVINAGGTAEFEINNPMVNGLTHIPSAVVLNADTTFANPALITGASRVVVSVGPPPVYQNDVLIVDGATPTLTFDPNSTLEVRMLPNTTPTGLISGLAWAIVDAGTITIGGTNGFWGQAGDYTYHGGNGVQFGDIILNLPDLWDGATSGYYNWNLSLFESNGIIVLVPEPSRALLVLLATSLGLLMRRRR